MNNTHLRKSRQEKGQTLIIALIILGVLLVLGAVYAGILGRTIKSTDRSVEADRANDFAEAGIRYAHEQLMNSELGADWRGQPTLPITAEFTTDPDAYYLRPAPRVGGNPVPFPGRNYQDQGGPDGMGPFHRVSFNNGRALVRVRYAPGDSAIFTGRATIGVTVAAVGGLQEPGKARNYLVIESVGRPGAISNPSDPTLSARRGRVRVRNFANAAQVAGELNRMKAFDEKLVTGRKLFAFAQIGITDYSRFVHNKYRVTRPAEIGIPTELGARMVDASGGNVPVQPVQVLGSRAVSLLNIVPGGSDGTEVPGAPVNSAFGGIRVNGDLRIHGGLSTNLNPVFGDVFAVSGNVQGADRLSRLFLRTTNWNGTNWISNAIALNNNNGLDSSSDSFNTVGGVFRDGQPTMDAAGAPRGIGYLRAPTVLPNDDTDGVSRYVKLTRDSGFPLNRTGGSGEEAANSGRYGHGQGVYVDNASDFQVPSDERGRQLAGGNVSQVQDWLNPYGQGTAFRSGWKGPFYIPVGASLRLTFDGFYVTRNAFPDQDPTERTWKAPNGADSGQATLRYRVGRGSDGQIRLINGLTPGLSASVEAPGLTPADFDNGPVFNGVLYFEGNVRVRGIIPTDVQMTVVSNRTVYIEGSLLKGMVGNDVTESGAVSPVGYGIPFTRASRFSRSTLMLMAKDYVTLNPTMFVGPAAERNTQTVAGGQGNGGFNALRLLAPDGGLSLDFEIPYDDTTGQPSFVEYTTTTSNPTTLLMTQALEYSNPGPTSAFYTLNINTNLGSTIYDFETGVSATNGTIPHYLALQGAAPAYGPIYGLGANDWQRSPKFETVAHTLVPVATLPTIAADTLGYNTVHGAQNYRVQGNNRIELDATSFGNVPTGNILLARAAIVPADVRIEASIFAEEGSFFVIPGDWFNPNSADTREAFIASLNAFLAQPAVGGDRAIAYRLANEERLKNYGTTPQTPFYGEPLDIKIKVIGSIAENMPPPMAQQAEWLRKWGWIPGTSGATGQFSGTNVPNIPNVHRLNNIDFGTGNPNLGDALYYPNLEIQYDPVLATGRARGQFSSSRLPLDANNPVVRFEVGADGEVVNLPPMPRLPVSPTLAYFGELK